MYLYILWLSAFAWSTSKCEPPVNSYLPPSNGNAGNVSPQYGPPEFTGNTRTGSNRPNNGENRNQPQDSYFPPGQSGSSRPLETQYGPPSSQGFGQGSTSPSQFGSRPQVGPQRPGNSNGPSSQYGVPGGANQENRQSSQANRQTSFNGANGGNRQQPSFPSRGQGIPANNGFGSNGVDFSQRPESSYGPPPSGDFGIGGQSSPRSQGTPDSSYLAPLADGRSDAFDGRQVTGGSPSSLYGAPGFGSGSGNRGSSAQGSFDSDESNEPAKYEFNYEVDDAQTGTKFGHTEQRDGDTAIGEYNVELPDGRKQVVEYEAGLQGYKPQIRYEGGRGGATSGLTSDSNIRSPSSSQGYSQGGPTGNNNEIGFSQESTQDGRPGRYQQSEEFSQGGLRSQDFMGYPSGRPGGQNGGNSYTNPGQNGFAGQSKFTPGNGDNGLENLNNGNQGGRGYPNADSERGYPRGGPQSSNINSPQGNNKAISNGATPGGDRGYPRGGSQVGGRGQSNFGEKDGYPTGGPSGRRGSGY